MDRIRIEIDGSAYLEHFADGSGEGVIVFVHGIFGSYIDSWGATPSQMMTSTALSKYDYASFGYPSSIFDRRGPEDLVDQLILWIRTYVKNYEEIFFVTHSMGGLLVRHALVKMLTDETDRDIARRVRLCIMIATPVSGSWMAAALCRVPFASYLNAKLRYLAKPMIGKEDMSAAYLRASEVFTKSGGQTSEIPRFSYFVGGEDKFVFRPSSTFFTDYDDYQGPVPGGHGGVKSRLDVNSVLMKNTLQLIQEASSRGSRSQLQRIDIVKQATRKREKATQERLITNKSTSSGVGQSVSNVILISCSQAKSDAAGNIHSKDGAILERLSEPRLEKLVIESRSRILRLIHEGKIDGIEFAQGNRASMPVNQQLLFGPDFGGVLNEPKYLPVYKRYSGRCFQATEGEWQRNIDNPTGCEFLIMSGLYGLVSATDHIQNYDVHLTDVDVSAGISLQSYWKDRELMTQILIAHLEWIDENRAPVGLVVDALSELSYQETINWAMVEPRWNVLHRVFENKSGRDALENLGIWLRDVITDPGSIEGLQKDVFYENTRFYSPDRIAFEAKIGTCELPVARESDNY